MPDHCTTRQVADLYGVEEWKVRRLFEAGIVTEPPKFGGKRLIVRTMLPSILDGLRQRGWMPAQELAAK